VPALRLLRFRQRAALILPIIFDYRIEEVSDTNIRRATCKSASDDLTLSLLQEPLRIVLSCDFDDSAKGSPLRQ